MTQRRAFGLGRAAVAAGIAVASSAAQADAPGLQVLAQRGHVQCPLAGQDERSLLIDNAAQWRAALAVDENQALGRAADWRHERVLVHALAQQPTLGVQVRAVSLAPESAGLAPRLGLRVTRPAADAMAATALSRPCVFAVLARGGWRSLRWVDAEAPTRLIATVAVGSLPATTAPAPMPQAPSTELLRPADPVAPTK